MIGKPSKQRDVDLEPLDEPRYHRKSDCVTEDAVASSGD